jgi:SAM-dependent methyltransferase
MESALGENDPDVALVKAILADVSEPAFARLRALYCGRGAFKFADVVFWTHHKLRRARTLGLDAAAPRSIWDIGCGGGHFSRVCQHFGHRVLGTDIDSPVYGDIAAALGVERTIDAIVADRPTTDFRRKFDLITAIAVEFNHLHPQTRDNPRYWSLDHWRFLLNDLIDRQLNFPGRIHVVLNCEMRGGEAVHNVELMRLCARHGADANERRGIIDWKLEGPVTL